MICYDYSVNGPKKYFILIYFNIFCLITLEPVFNLHCIILNLIIL